MTEAARVHATGPQVASATAGAQQAAAEDDPERSVVPWLRALGLSLGEARRAAERCAGMSDASLEQRVRVALSYKRPGR